MKAFSPAFILLLLSVFSFAAIDSHAATLTVTKTDDTNDGVCDADCSLREAVAVAMPNDTVVFSSLFNTAQMITLTLGQMAIDRNLTITGTGQELVTISGNNAGRIFLITGTGVTVNISGITFRDGNGSDFGGGAIYVYDSTLIASNAEFTNNTAGQHGGGAIYGTEASRLTLSNLVVEGNVSQGQAILGYSIDIRDSVVRQNTGWGIESGNFVSVERCVISDNSGAGVAAEHLTIVDSTVANNPSGGVWDGDSASTMTIERCIISGNSRFPTGGGVKSVGTTVIKNSQIKNNTAVDYGGGISNAGTLYLINSLVSENQASGTGGGGIETAMGRLFVINSTVSGNHAPAISGVGGGIYNLVNAGNPNGRVFLVNSTIANNTSSGAGGGIKCDVDGVVTFSNTVVAANNSNGTSQEDVSGVMTSNGINLIRNTTGSSGWIAGDLLNVNPMLGPLGNNGGSTFTQALLSGSPAINAGNNLLAVDPLTMLPLTQDQRGRSRIVGGKNPIVDIGAYEALYSQSPVTVSGRITTYSGRGIERIRIKVDDGQGNIFYTQTNPFGFYRLNNLIPGTTYTITVTHKLYLFTSPQFFTADQNRDDLNFTTKRELPGRA
jgi:CSLREA domain-containing protein